MTAQEIYMAIRSHSAGAPIVSLIEEYGRQQVDEYIKGTQLIDAQLSQNKVTIKAKALKHKQIQDDFLIFSEFGRTYLSSIPQLLPETATIGGIIEYSSDELEVKLRNEYDLIDVTITYEKPKQP